MTQPCICIHGHFYQPPRENPWIEDIEKQESAHPFHDWNERIHNECYRPNSRARVFGDKRAIVDIVNNYEMMSFNFGPTLIGWMREKDPETYARILEADRKSKDAHAGHGNAIAQCYNHMIMPLANRRDKVTQIRWGIEDFRRHFGRDPEGMWLPETGCNEETLSVLAEEGIKFTILEPHQAESMKPIGDDNWQDVSSGNIDPKMPYRCFVPDGSGRHIDIFFYDGPISRAVGFEHLVRDAKVMMDRLETAKFGDGPQLIHIATDGETYGHHKSFGDRTLAYLLHTEAPKRGFRVVNYGEYLAEHPPTHEVKIKQGENGEGTAWSCAHGVRRWKDDCGCRGDGPPHWRQDWRRPLREALDWLRDELVTVFEETASQYIKSPWSARDSYIQVILDRSNGLKNFLSRHAVRELKPEEINKVLRLFEMQRFAMLMYTSCGWFFTELSGIETVQILQYAARAAQLAYEINGKDYEKEFVEKLKYARSNLDCYKDGKGVFEKCVKNSVVNLRRVASYFAIGSIFKQLYADKNSLNIYAYNFEVISRRMETAGSATLNFGRVKVSSSVTFAKSDFIFAVFKIDPYDFRCAIRDFSDEEEYHKLEAELFDTLSKVPVFDAIKKLEDSFDGPYYGLKDLLFEDRFMIIKMLTHESLEKVSAFHDRGYDDNLRMAQLYQSIGLSIPEEFNHAIGYVLNRRIPYAVREFIQNGLNLRKAGPLYRLMDIADSMNIEVHKKQISRFLSVELENQIKDFVNNPRKEPIQHCLAIHKLAKRMSLHLDQEPSQEEIFLALKHWREDVKHLPESLPAYRNQIIQLLEDLRIADAEIKKALRAA